jgi:hypothetical protein
MERQDLLDDLPHLKEFTGNVTGVGFQPGKLEVRLKSDGDPEVSLTATAEQVETALALRHSLVRALAVVGKQSRLVGLQPADAPAINVTPEYLDRHIFKRWDTLLRKLAE